MGRQGTMGLGGVWEIVHQEVDDITDVVRPIVWKKTLAREYPGG